LARWQLVTGGLPLLAFSQVFESGRAIHWTASFAGILVFLALAGSALTTLIWFWALQKWDAGTLSLYLFLVPVFGIAIAVGIYGESIRFADNGGSAFRAQQWPRRRRRASLRPQP
jgi:drug/metabolite transporter (DMT)-like permease